MIALTLFAVLIVATLVQSDSPRSATAFWVTRPLAPSAVLAAKVGMIVFLLLLPSLGEAAGLAMLRVSAGRMVSLIGGGLVAFGAWLLVAALFAAVTTDLPAFILVYVAVPLGGLALLWMLASPSTAGGASTSDVQRNVATAVSVAAGLGLLALVFRRRDIGRGIWLPVLVVGPGLMVARAIGVRPALRPTAPDAFVAFHVTPSPQQVRGYLGIHAGPDSLGPDRRVQLTYDSIVVGLRDGKSVTVMGTGSYGNYGSGTPVGGSDWSWHGCHSFVWNSPTADQSIQLTATQSAIVAAGGGIASIDLYGRAVESRARILTRAIPPGTWRNVAEGLRVRVAGVRSGPDDITARLETIDVPHDAVPLAPF
ncbi:MAG: hypothetical protein KGL38_14270, partial [Gemmatimonadota bacterium]|nr:hypothetical protein [Gemmatimonadota bacterium]